jgi:hypothetical protein
VRPDSSLLPSNRSLRLLSQQYWCRQPNIRANDICDFNVSSFCSAVCRLTKLPHISMDCSSPLEAESRTPPAMLQHSHSPRKRNICFEIVLEMSLVKSAQTSWYRPLALPKRSPPRCNAVVNIPLRILLLPDSIGRIWPMSHQLLTGRQVKCLHQLHPFLYT